MQKRHLVKILLTLVLLSATNATAQKTQEGQYFLQLHANVNALTFNVTTPLNQGGINDVSHFTSKSRLSPLLRELLALPGVNQLFLHRYELTLYKADGAQTAAIVTSAKYVLEQHFGPLLPEEPEQHGVTCKTRGDKPGEFNKIRYILSCPPNPDVVTYTFDAMIVQGWDDFDWDMRSQLGNSHTIWLDELRKIAGLKAVKLKGNVLDVIKAPAFRWVQLEPKVRAVLAGLFEKSTGFRKAEMLHPANFPPVIFNKVQIPGDGFAWQYPELSDFGRFR